MRARYLTFRYEAPSAVGAAFALLALLLSRLFALLVMQRASVTFDWSSRRILLTRTRWPQRKFKRVFELAEVQRATVKERMSKGSVIFQVALVLRDGEEVPLVDAWSSGGIEWHQLATASIDELLKRRDDQAREGAV